MIGLYMRNAQLDHMLNAQVVSEQCAVSTEQ